jgi:hypothetical protein
MKRPTVEKPSRATLSRQRRAAGLVLAWVPRAAIEEAAVDVGVIEQWDVDSERKLQKALRRYLIEIRK